MKMLFLILVAALPVYVFAQNKIINDPDAQARPVSAFHGIKVATGIHLIITQGATEALAVSAPDEKLRNRIKTEVVDGILKIYYDYKVDGILRSWSLPKGVELKAYVSFKSIDKFSGSSGSHTSVEGSIDAGALEIVLSSGAKFSGAVKANGLSVNQSSGAKIYLKGQAQSLTVDASSGAGFYGYGISAGKCDIDVSSGGKAEVMVTGELIADASSGGKIDYKGSGVITKISAGSGGKVRKG